MFASGNEMGSIKMKFDSADHSTQADYKHGIFSLLIFIPIVCAIVQLLAWSRFSLHGKRLKWVKAMRSGAAYSTV